MIPKLKFTDRLGELSKDTKEFLPSLQVLAHETMTHQYFKDWLIERMIREDLPVIEAATEWLLAYKGSTPFLLSVRRKVQSGRRMTPRQARAVINCAFKEGFTESDYFRVSGEASSSAPAAPEPPKPRFSCFKCGHPCFTWEELEAHREQAHPYVFRCRMCDHETTDREAAREHRQEHYAPLFENVPQSGLDLTLIPEGRYAVPDLDPSSKDYLFLMVRKVPRDHTRSRKYRYGWKSYGIEQVAAGTLEVRLWHGDAKELVGEQRPGETYRGDFTDEFKLIMKDPTASSKLFGLLINCCGKCGKTLTDPESRKRGIGPECVKRFAAVGGPTKVEAHEAPEKLAEKMRSIGRASGTLPSWASRRPTAGQKPPALAGH